MERRTFTLAGIAGLLMTNSAYPSSTAPAPRLLAFKQRIGFDAAVAAERADQYVSLALDAIPAPPVLQSWTAKRNTVRLSESESGVVMVFEHDGARVTVRLSVFQPGDRTSPSQRLIDKADAVSTMDITDERGPADLGTLSVVPRGGDASLVYWMFRNVYSEVVTYKTPIAALEVARWLQQHYERNLRAN